MISPKQSDWQPHVGDDHIKTSQTYTIVYYVKFKKKNSLRNNFELWDRSMFYNKTLNSDNNMTLTTSFICMQLVYQHCVETQRQRTICQTYQVHRGGKQSAPENASKGWDANKMYKAHRSITVWLQRGIYPDEQNTSKAYSLLHPTS